MKYIILLLVCHLCACTGNLKSNLNDEEKQALSNLRSNFFNTLGADEALSDIKDKKISSMDTKNKAHNYFECSHEHKTTSFIAYQTITVEFEEMELRDALTEISIVAGVTIITDDSVEGIISGSFKDKGIGEVLSILLSVGDFDFRFFDSYVFIGSTDPTAGSYHQLSSTCIYRPSHLDALSLVTLLPEFYQRYLKINKQNGFIAITAPRMMMHRIQHDIVLFDLPQKQVVMELSIIEISQEALEILGMDWQSIKNKTSSVYNQSLGQSSYGGRTVTLPSMKAMHFLDAVNALKRNGNADVKSMPSIVVLEGKEARFRSMNTIWSPDVMSTSHKKEAIEVGVQMAVVPKVSNVGHIQLDIKKASVSDFIIDTFGLPKVIEHSLSSSVSIDNGETLIIGGLLQKKKRIQNSGVPYIKDVPLLGRLFSNKVERVTDSEILIMIQPRIIRG
jgi:type II secretory pathway component GspD/PulD (secretin)